MDEDFYSSFKLASIALPATIPVQIYIPSMMARTNHIQTNNTEIRPSIQSITFITKTPKINIAVDGVRKPSKVSRICLGCFVKTCLKKSFVYLFTIG